MLRRDFSDARKMGPQNRGTRGPFMRFLSEAARLFSPIL
jgi:hypothetical protein